MWVFDLLKIRNESEDRIVRGIFGLNIEQTKANREERHTRHNQGHQIKVGEMSGVCSTYARYEKWLHNSVETFEGQVPRRISLHGFLT
jgi:hypothetical protein